ncbi:MAG: hypothetical protein HY851_05410 [candidate division Zixibacteria bacterium]|nr:hypothetical protein [candidate division Zixibacteria bacterium]
MVIKKRTLLALVPVVLFLSMTSAHLQTSQSKVIEIEALWEKGKVVLKVNSEVVGDQILRVLQDKVNDFGPDQKIVVFLDDRVPLWWIGNVAGIAGKAQLNGEQKFYAVARKFGDGELREISLSAPVEYSRESLQK